MCMITTWSENVAYLERKGGVRIQPCTALRVQASSRLFEANGVGKGAL